MAEQLSKVTYLSNAGVLVELDDQKILIDSLCNSTIPLYRNPPAATREQMILGVSPFDNIDCLLFTHHHSDHFDPEGAAVFLRHHKEAFIISTSAVISQISDQLSHMESKRLVALDTTGEVLQDIQINGIKIRSVAMRHDGEQYRDVPNLAYLIAAAGKKILHVGDAKPIPENYLELNLAAENIDLLLAPFPYVGLPKGRQVIEAYIKPKKIAVIHLPVREFDHGGWINSTMKNYLKVKNDFTETVFFEDTGDYTTIS
jgi:L-ascorbate metabolism protein UlaG (beta-lactamase superfamily)